MTPLRQRMIEDMTLRNLSPQDHPGLRRLRRHASPGTSASRPKSSGPTEIRSYLLHLVQERHVSWSYYNQALRALQFLYHVTLGRDWVLDEHRLPQAAQEAPGRPQPRRSGPVLRGHHQPQAPRHPHDRLRRRPAALRGRWPCASTTSTANAWSSASARARAARTATSCSRPGCWTLLREYWKAGPARPDWLFPGDVAGRPLTAGTVHRGLRAARSGRGPGQARHRPHPAA